MTSLSSGLTTPNRSDTAPIQEHVDREIDHLLASFPKPEQLSADERRGMIARYTAVLEGNFIYWMTGAYLAVGSGGSPLYHPGEPSRRGSRLHPAVL